MLLTICPNCTAQFKVQPEQLNVRQGRVMCGRCRHVFNAFQSLSRLEETDGGGTSGAELAAAPQPADMSQASKRLALPREPAATHATISVQEEPLPPAVEVNAGEANKFSISDLEPFEAPRMPPAIDLSGTSNPLLVEAPPVKTSPTKASSASWMAGAFLLSVGVAAQLTFMFRTTVATAYPELRPPLIQMCEIAKCAIPWGRDAAQFEIVGSELIEAPGKPGRILLTATLINRAKAKQDLPSLDLKLTDNANQVVVGRALHPGDYLGRAIEKGEGIAANAELYLSLTLEISGKQLASGYGLLPFYP